MSKPLTLEEIEWRITYLEGVRKDLLRNNCEEGALAIGSIIHSYKKVIGWLDLSEFEEKKK